MATPIRPTPILRGKSAANFDRFMAECPRSTLVFRPTDKAEAVLRRMAENKYKTERFQNVQMP